MKRIFLVTVLILSLMLSLTGCSKPEDEVIKAIDAIGEVTLDSLELIEYAEDLYSQLETGDKVNVTNRSALTKARTEYNRQKKLLEDASDAIDAIGTVTYTSGDKVEAARQAYDAAAQYDVSGTLSTKEKVLLAAENQLKKAQEEVSNLSTTLMQLYDAGKFEELEATAKPYIADLPDGELKNLLGSYVVEALCARAQEQYGSGDCMAAMQTLSRRSEYKSICDRDVYELAEDIEADFISAMSRNAPANGTILARTYDAGRNTFTVTAGSTDTCVKVELINDPSKYVVFFVKAKQKVTVNLLNGTYAIKYTTGPIWYDKDNMFGPDATYIKLSDTMELAGYSSGNRIYWHTVTCTLRSGYGDNLGAQNMKPSDF